MGRVALIAGVLWSGGALADGEAPCLPRVGETVRLAQTIRAQSGVVVRVFEPHRNDAEFRGCERDMCGLMIHPRVETPAGWRPAPVESRGFGEEVEVPREELAGLVVLPECTPKPIPEPPPPVRRRPRRPRPKPRPEPPAPAPEPAPLADGDAQAAVAPRPSDLLARVPGPEGPLGVGGALNPGPFGVIEPDSTVPLNRRIAAVIASDGRLSFEPNTEGGGPLGGMPINPEHDGLVGDTLDGYQPMQGGLGGSGEGLNALDGADIDGPLKEAFAKATFDQRFGLYRSARRRAVAESLGVLHGRLRDLDGLDSAAQRAAIFALWHTHADSDDPAAHGAFSDAGAQARALIEHWVRRHLPPGPEGFGVDELVELNRGVGRVGSRRPFDPYDQDAVRARLQGADAQAAVDAGLP